MFISTFNARTLTSDSQIGELVAAAASHKQDIICIQEHRYHHTDLHLKHHDVGNNWTLITSSAWKNSTNASIGGIGMLLSPMAQKALNNIETISPRILVASFNGNPKTTVICCYSPTNVSEVNEEEEFYDKLSSLTRQVPRHDVTIIAGDFNAKIGQNDGFFHSFHKTSNRNGKMFGDFLKENKMLCLNTKFQKKLGKRWTFTYPNGIKAQLDYILINKKWSNSAINCQPYNSFDCVSSDHRIVTATIRLSLRANTVKSAKFPRYDWSILRNNKETADSFKISLKNRFSVLKEDNGDDSANLAYCNFEAAFDKAAKECIPLKPKIKHRIPWETENVVSKREELKRAAKIRNSQPNRVNNNNLKKADKLLKLTYEEEQVAYLQSKIDFITKASTNKQAATAWKTVNEISGRKSSNKAKLKADSQTERLDKWKSHFENLLGNQPKIIDKPIKKIVQQELDIEKECLPWMNLR